MTARVGDSLDYEEALAQIAGAAVPRLADWCVLHVPREDGALDPVAVAHVDPQRVRWARELQERYPARVDDDAGVARVLRSGRGARRPSPGGRGPPPAVPPTPAASSSTSASPGRYSCRWFVTTGCSAC